MVGASKTWIETGIFEARCTQTRWLQKTQQVEAKQLICWFLTAQAEHESLWTVDGAKFNAEFVVKKEEWLKFLNYIYNI